MTASRRIALTVGLAVFAAAAAGAVVAGALQEGPRALERPASAADALPAGVRGFEGLEAGESRLAARFTTAAGAQRGVYITRTEDGSMTCLWDTDLRTGGQGGGCNPTRDFFAGRSIVISLSYDGGPSITSVSEARIVGVVTDEVAGVEVVNSDGVSRPVPISPDRAFAHVVPPSDLKRGTGPVAVVAFDSSGGEVDRQPTGIG